MSSGPKWGPVKVLGLFPSVLGTSELQVGVQINGP